MKYNSSSRLTGSVLLFCYLWGGMVFAQTCLPAGITFSSQAQIDAFSDNYPDCMHILGDVIIEEAVRGDITNLRGLSGITTFGDYLEIHDNEILSNLEGLESVTLIKGGLNIFGNPGLLDLSGLENLTEISASLRVAFNHEVKDIKALQALQVVGEDLTISDNRRMVNLKGLEALHSLGGYLIIILNDGLRGLQGLNALTGVGKGLLVEDNPNLYSLSGLGGVTDIGSNCIIVNNRSLQSLEGLESLETLGGHLQIANNSFLGEVTALARLHRMNGLLQIYNNPGLRSLSGLDSIDHKGITDLAIVSCDVLSTCAVQSICSYLEMEDNLASISLNGTGCNFRRQILNSCSRDGPNVSPPRRRDPIFFPNPTSGKVDVKGEGLDDARIEVADVFGRILLREALEAKTVDLSDLAAGIYFIKLQAKDLEVISKVIKLN